MTKPPHHHVSPWTLDIRAAGLAQHNGAGYSHQIDITAEPNDRIAVGVLEIPDGHQVAVTGRAESVAEGVIVSATVSAVAVGTCSRCLAPIDVPLDVSFRELYAYPDSLTARTTDEDEVPRIDDERIDLAPVVRDELILAMPTIPLCRDDCPGLCPECGQRLDEVEPGHGHEILDPRWAGLRGLLDVGSDDESTSRQTAPAGHPTAQSATVDHAQKEK